MLLGQDSQKLKTLKVPLTIEIIVYNSVANNGNHYCIITTEKSTIVESPLTRKQKTEEQKKAKSWNKSFGAWFPGLPFLIRNLQISVSASPFLRSEKQLFLKFPKTSRGIYVKQFFHGKAESHLEPASEQQLKRLPVTNLELTKNGVLLISCKYVSLQQNELECIDFGTKNLRSTQLN